MGNFVQNKSMDALFNALMYFGLDTDLVIIESRFINVDNENCCLKNTIRFEGKIKNFNVLEVEAGRIKFAETFDILNMVPENNRITVYIYEYI